MKKTIITSLLIVAILLLAVTMTFAGGDQVQGDKAAGPAEQYQYGCPNPFTSISTGFMLYQTSWSGNIILFSK